MAIVHVSLSKARRYQIFDRATKQLAVFKAEEPAGSAVRPDDGPVRVDDDKPIGR
jgi:hypothetical protein